MYQNYRSPLQGSYCLNCGTALKGPYCHYCGQKKLGHEHGFLHTMFHFIGDFFHFDSKIFKTIIPLLFRPGFLAKEYIAGRRADYLDPVRMYVFLSLIFFSLLYLYKKETDSITIKVQNNLKMPEDSMIATHPEAALKNLQKTVETDSAEHFFLVLGEKGFNSVEEYKSWQQSLQEDERHGKLLSGLMVKLLSANERTGNQNNFSEVFQHHFVHNLPKLAFLLLPLAALWLNLLYIRSGISYMHHLILVIQSYNVNYLILSIFIALSLLVNDIEWIGYVLTLLALHFIVSLKIFYRNSWKKTLWKAFVFFWGCILMLSTGAALNAIYSILTM